MTAAALKHQVREDVAGARSAVKSLLNQAMKTPFQLRQLADAIEADERGEPVEGANNASSPWFVVISPNFESPTELFRPAPKPVTRPWRKPEDVPAVCWIRGSESDKFPALVIGIFEDGVTLWNGFSDRIERYQFQGISCEHSIDRKTWLPCVVTEAQP